LIVVAAGALAVGGALVEEALGTFSSIVGYSRVFGRIFVALAEALVVFLAVGPGPYAFSPFSVLEPFPYIFSIAAFAGFAEFQAEASAAFVFAAFVFAAFVFAAFAGFAEFHASAAFSGFQAFIGFQADTSAALFAFAFFAAFIAFMIALLGVMFLDCTSLESSSVESVDATSAPMERRSNLLFML
jgi:hypothetical protein